MRLFSHIFFSFIFLCASLAVSAAPVDINSADARTLADALTGIGPERAEAIVDYRDAHGPFKSVDELISVKGIGEKTLENIRNDVMIGTSAVSLDVD
jgi:competence protein ComEA